MRMTLGMCVTMIVMAQSVVSGKANAASTNPSQISSDCEQVLAQWVMASNAAYEEPNWRAVTKSSRFTRLSEAVKNFMMEGCLDDAPPKDPTFCDTAGEEIDDLRADVRNMPEHAAYVQSDIYRNIVEATNEVKSTACLEENETYFFEATFMP